MADREVSSLPRASQITPEALLPVFVPGSTTPAQSATGAQFAAFAKEGAKEAVSAEVNKAAASASAAEKSAKNATESAANADESASGSAASAANAAQSAANAQNAREAIENMEVRADTLGAGSAATVRKEVVDGVVRLTYGIPEGKQGATGPAGAEGKQGPPGPQGISGVAVAADGQYAFNVNEDGDLILSYTGDTAPNMHINEDGYLILTI